MKKQGVANYQGHAVRSPDIDAGVTTPVPEPVFTMTYHLNTPSLLLFISLLKISYAMRPENDSIKAWKTMKSMNKACQIVKERKMNILECTIKMKRETHAHYVQLAEIATDKDLKRLFSLMAAAEDQHIAALSVMRDDNMGLLGMQDVNKLDESVCVYSPHIDPRHLAESLRNDPDAYRHVVQEEEDTIEFFDQLGNQADSEELKRICRLQADKEREHLAVLENIYFFVEEPRSYLEWGEFSNLKSL